MDLMSVVLIIVIIVLVVKNIKKSKATPPMALPPIEEETMAPVPELSLAGAYQKRWMFTFNEKDAYSKLQPIAKELGYTVFAKVRVLDLIEPVEGNPKYKTFFYKIQAKHVDFVLCDQKLVARYVIELDDSSHEKQQRKQRDEFLNQALTSAGHKVIHVKAITEEIKEQLQ